MATASPFRTPTDLSQLACSPAHRLTCGAQENCSSLALQLCWHMHAGISVMSCLDFMHHMAAFQDVYCKRMAALRSCRQWRAGMNLKLALKGYAPRDRPPGAHLCTSWSAPGRCRSPANNAMPLSTGRISVATDLEGPGTDSHKSRPGPKHCLQLWNMS